MAVLGIIVLLAILGVVAKCVYNAFLHPLRHYPGPKLAGVTRAYYLWYDVRGVSHWKVKEWHEKYGEVVRIAPGELSYTSSQAWQAIYGFPNREGNGNYEKDAQWWNKNVNGVENILTADDAGHKRMRRLQNPAFSDKALKAQESVITGYVNLLVHQLHGQVSSPDTSLVDMNSWYNFTTFDIIGDLAFGEPFYCLRDAQWHWWLHAVFDIFQAGTYLRAARRFPSPLSEMLLLLIPRRLIKTRVAQFNFGVERVNKRLEKKTERPDFMYYVLQGTDENGMTMEEIYAAAQVLIVAGSETTATALTTATYYLCENPDTLAKLTAEIRDTFEKEEDITIQSTAKLSYLNAVIEEALRLGPPGPGTFPRVVPGGGRTVCGEFVAGGYSVGVHHLSVNRSPVNFREHDGFHPERWLGDERFESDKKSAAQPFSFGPRNCIGKNLAYAEIRVILARVVWNFDMKLHPDSAGWLGRQKMFTTWHKTEMKVHLSARAR
ncbi:Cytochrome P450 monooxygenase [Colletotrichum fructicola]|uniref:Cytochrome P450 monooxygenase aclL n=1 Tax=Colletotrichum fructicola (strain Nara gc5) TaxID=1213859 RepID=L2FM19_COLFN|nr:Cytochrome P450 monooxygenase [Colletotrichum fructicola]KAE9583259.1 Cytochrome P450 monooxygenase [Colletotrichum fructicola]KAF4412749.1 Cytochrome P450 monooxygenase aclL [Colletotrichum fructicola]KAF4481483.1 Cytochrome P450 monooxygenase aclL [Colletotrichum fructicola Nara gc5]KAF4886233.1 Cytochrome P450 monooxygenase aclL [Colletotrichum fructicola]